MTHDVPWGSISLLRIYSIFLATSVAALPLEKPGVGSLTSILYLERAGYVRLQTLGKSAGSILASLRAQIEGLWLHNRFSIEGMTLSKKLDPLLNCIRDKFCWLMMFPFKECIMELSLSCLCLSKPDPCTHFNCLLALTTEKFCPICGGKSCLGEALMPVKAHQTKYMDLVMMVAGSELLAPP